ncbi:hypothetical protein [Isoptericola sp. NPDC057191]|uniref:hypothetical protein n=1 Tax=Isoptericola sp. NPDC057191 TaxID=3346041 RepID=UPI003642EEF9
MSSVPPVDTALATPALARAVEIFRELGWDGADPQDALTLPLGSPEQRRAALAGLRRGPWLHHVVPDVPVTLGGLHDLDDGAWGWAAATDVDLGLLTLFAVRQGVDAARAVRLLTEAEGLPDNLVARVVATRGADFAARFVERAGTSSWGEFSTTTLGGVVVLLVHRLCLDVPDDPEYHRDWAAYAAATLPGAPEEWPGHWRPLPADLLRPRYAEHARAAVAAGLPSTGAFGNTFAAAVDAGWIARDEAVDLAFQALDAATRPGDRKAWCVILTSPGSARVPGLAATPDEILARADLLVGVLATGEAPLVEAFAPTLVEGADPATLADVLLVSLAVATKKAQRTVLAAAARRAAADGGAGAEVVDLVGDRVAELAAGRARRAGRVGRPRRDGSRGGHCRGLRTGRGPLAAHPARLGGAALRAARGHRFRAHRGGGRAPAPARGCVRPRSRDLPRPGRPGRPPRPGRGAHRPARRGAVVAGGPRPGARVGPRRTP